MQGRFDVLNYLYWLNILQILKENFEVTKFIEHHLGNRFLLSRGILGFSELIFLFSLIQT